MAITAVTTFLGKDAADVPCEAERFSLLRSLNTDLGPDDLPGNFDFQSDFSIGESLDPSTLINSDDRTVGNRETAQVRDIALNAIRKAALHQKPLEGILAPEDDIARHNTNRQWLFHSVFGFARFHIISDDRGLRTRPISSSRFR
jgi:hypothetical protein